MLFSIGATSKVWGWFWPIFCTRLFTSLFLAYAVGYQRYHSKSRRQALLLSNSIADGNILVCLTLCTIKSIISRIYSSLSMPTIRIYTRVQGHLASRN